MQGAESAYFIILGLIQCSYPATFNGFENDKTCLWIENKPSQETQTMTVKKDDITAIIFWNLDQGKWKAKIPEDYRNQITGSNGTVENFTFCFENTSVNDSGTYIWRDNEENNDFLTLDVWYGPRELIISPEIEKVLYLDENASLAINCSADCNPDCNIIWKSETNVLSSHKTLSLKKISQIDSGNYTCCATNPKNRSHALSETIRILVKYGAKINLTMHGNSDVVEYSDVNVTCSVDSYPVSNISWFRKNEQLNTAYDRHNKRVLNLCNTTCDDSGIYTCSAYNGIGTESAKDIFIDVLCSPRFIGAYSGHEIKKMMSVSIGDEIQMNVTIKANPSPEVISNTFYTVLTKVSDNMYDVFMWKRISSKFDFKVHLIIIGNSQGNVTIIIEVVEKKTIGYGLIIGLPLSLLVLISITILFFAVVKRVKHRKVNQAVNVNPASNTYSGEYRDSELCQSIDHIFRPQRFNLDVQNVDDIVEEDLQYIYDRPEEDRMSISNRVTSSPGNKPEGLNVKIQSNVDKIKGRKPMPRPRKSKTCSNHPEEIPQTKKQNSSSYVNIASPEIQTIRNDRQTEMSGQPPLDLDNSYNKGSRYTLIKTQQFGLPKGNCRDYLANEVATTSAQKVITVQKVINTQRDQMDPLQGANGAEKYPGLKSNYLLVDTGHGYKQHKPRIRGIKPFTIENEAGNLPTKDNLSADQPLSCAHVKNIAYVEPIQTLDAPRKRYSTRDEDDTDQFHDYMNM